MGFTQSQEMIKIPILVNIIAWKWLRGQGKVLMTLIPDKRLASRGARGFHWRETPSFRHRNRPSQESNHQLGDIFASKGKKIIHQDQSQFVCDTMYERIPSWTKYFLISTPESGLSGDQRHSFGKRKHNRDPKLSIKITINSQMCSIWVWSAAPPSSSRKSLDCRKLLGGSVCPLSN